MAWLLGYTRRKSKVVENLPTGIPDYQMKLTIYKNGLGPDSPTAVYLGGNARDDFNDLRFTRPDGSTYLSYWIESLVSGNYAIVWINVPTDINPTHIYIYYDNPSETTSLSNESSIWTTYNYSSQFSGTQGSNGWYYYQRTRGAAPGTGWTAMNWDPVSYGGFWRGVGAWPLGLWSGQEHPYRSIDAVILWQSNTNQNLRISGYAYRGDSGGNGINNRIIKRNLSTNAESTLWTYTFPGIGGGTQNFNIETTKMSNESIDFYTDSLGDDGYDTQIFIPTVKTRRYASPEPTFGVSTEELNITATDMNLDKTSCIGPCTVNVYVQWYNYGNAAIESFTPAILIDNTILAYGAPISIPSLGTASSGAIVTPTLSAGSHSICPYPN